MRTFSNFLIPIIKSKILKINYMHNFKAIWSKYVMNIIRKVWNIKIRRNIFNLWGNSKRLGSWMRKGVTIWWTSLRYLFFVRDLMMLSNCWKKYLKMDKKILLFLRKFMRFILELITVNLKNRFFQNIHL